MNDLVVEIVGWTGAVLILGAYILVSMGRLDGRSPTFQWMNVIGAMGFVINSGMHGAVPSTVLNIVWMGIGLWTIYTLRRSAD